MIYLETLPNVTHLTVTSNNLTDYALIHLKPLKSLQSLDLSGPRTGGALTDAGLVHLRDLTNLRVLALSHNRKITSVGLKHLSQLTKLDCLFLSDTSVSDAGLEYLTGLARLEHLYLTDTQVSSTGVERFKQSRPGCDVKWYLDPSAWRKLVSFAGRGNRQTDTFNVPHRKWRIKWKTMNEYEFGVFSIFVHTESGEFVDAPVLSYVGAGSDETYLRSGPGEHYLQIQSANIDWEIIVESLPEIANAWR